VTSWKCDTRPSLHEHTFRSAELGLLVLVGSIHWAEWVTAGATVTLAAFGLFAWMAFKDARRTRHGQLGLELAKRWDGAEAVESFKLQTRFKSEGITALIELLFDPPEGKVWELEELNAELDRYYALAHWPNLLETVGVLWASKVVSIEFVYRMWGPGITSTWEVWEAPINRLREIERARGRTASADATYPFFEALAKELRLNSKPEKWLPKLDAGRRESPPEAAEAAEQNESES
jgi:hypothetical protein